MYKSTDAGRTWKHIGGFVTVLDKKTLVIPDRPGNNRIDGLLNLLKYPKIGLLFLIPSVDETLRINGSAEIIIDPNFCKSYSLNGRAPKSVTKVSIDEAFLHCGGYGRSWKSY